MLANSNEIRATAQTVRLRFITVEARVQSGIFSGQNSTGTNISVSLLTIRLLTYISSRIDTINLFEASVSRNTFVNGK